MKINEINKVFTDKVAEYLAKGYTINVPTMNGSQGEVGKVDLVKGDELIRVWMIEENERWNERKNFYHKSKVIVRVSRWAYPVSEIKNWDWVTIWTGALKTIEETEFYKVSNNWYVDTREEAMKIQEKNTARYKNKVVSYRDHEEFVINNEDIISIASKYLKRRAKYQRVSVGDIKVIKQVANDFCHAHYSVVYHGNTYKMS